MSAFRVSRKFLMRGAAIAAAAATGLIAGQPLAATKSAEVRQVVTGPVARYWVDTTTSSGFTMSGMMGGGRPSMGSIMSAAMGGGGPSHTLHLRLGSDRAATGDAAADHLPPAALDAGNDLPLYYKPIHVDSGPSTYEPQERDSQPETPHGKILIFWGCGEHAPKDQPYVIDLSKLTDDTARMSMFTKMMTPVHLDEVHPPAPDNSKTFGEWPNEKTRDGVKPDSSLVGAHTVKGNYSPEIDFQLDQTQDFMPAIQVSGNQRDQAGAVPLTWNAIPQSKGWVLTAMGGGQDTVVLWTSAASQVGWMAGAPDYMTSDDIARLLDDKILLPGSATSCTVPAEVASAAQGLLYGITAYGGETNMAYPERPKDPKIPWNIQWETKVRYRSTSGGMLGQEMGGHGGMGGMFGGGHNDDSADNGSSSDNSSSSSSSDDGKKKKKKGSLFGDMIKSAAGSFIP